MRKPLYWDIWKTTSWKLKNVLAMFERFFEIKLFPFPVAVFRFCTFLGVMEMHWVNWSSYHAFYKQHRCTVWCVSISEFEWKQTYRASLGWHIWLKPKALSQYCISKRKPFEYRYKTKQHRQLLKLFYSTVLGVLCVFTCVNKLLSNPERDTHLLFSMWNSIARAKQPDKKKNLIKIGSPYSGFP